MFCRGRKLTTFMTENSQGVEAGPADEQATEPHPAKRSRHGGEATALPVARNARRPRGFTYAARVLRVGAHQRHGTFLTSGPESPDAPTSTARRGWENFHPRSPQCSHPLSACSSRMAATFAPRNVLKKVHERTLRGRY
ncbi:hypothetical protein GCM10009527_018410 [Actinomadura nitritigenes]